MALAATIGMSLLGGIARGRGIAQESKAAAAAANYRAAVARNMARFSIEQGQVEEQQQRMKNNALKSQQRVALAANGVEVNSGSAVDLQASSEALGELDAQTIRQNARMRAASFNDQAQLDIWEGKNALRAGKIAQVSNILGTATSVADKWHSSKMATL